jgi:tagatose 1,6-diphosphate aldolase
VDYADYEKQVQMALQHGASGVLGGRAFWKEYFDHDGEAARMGFLRSEGLRRLTTIGDLVKQHAVPWFRRYGLSKASFGRVRIPEGWQRDYAAPGAPADPAPPRPAGSGGDY